MTGIIRGKNQKASIVNGVANHMHAFVGLKPSMLIAETIISPLRGFFCGGTIHVL